ncbi:DUF6882 domain-containing protein [Arcicella rosea]|uniref:Uncharacterized protein n=1 Tax=Arcicella rosea TaxID=502909 RepID=A0A841F0C3_9BACT|nr:DUF6882 domain-containing protein [Arcicella rosea]MBB6005211.1 hypothetical protein [Arcicella rosea]
MGLLKKLFGQSEKSTPTDNQSQQALTPCKTEEELLERYGGIALDKQIDFGTVIGNNSWEVDLHKGTISFGEDLTFPMQALGTISHSSQTWLWAWANTKSGLSESIVEQSLHLKKYGVENDIDLLTSEKFDFSSEELHLIGMIASGMFNSSGYYIADYGQGAMLVTIKDSKFEGVNNESHQRILTVFPQLISLFEMNHKSAFKNYLMAKGYKLTETENSIVGTKNSESVSGQFDEYSRLTNLKG